MEKLAGPGPNTSVFVGCYTKDYHDVQTRDPETMPPSTLTGNYTAMFSNRVSHFYDFQGASMSIDTGCSAALAALHQACQTIRSGESHVSIVGASNTILNPDIYIAMSTLGYVTQLGLNNFNLFRVLGASCVATNPGLLLFLAWWAQMDVVMRGMRGRRATVVEKGWPCLC